MVITLQNIPAEIEEALQRKAAEEGKSLDRVTLDALALALGLGENGHEVTSCNSKTLGSQATDFADKTDNLVTQSKKVRDLSDVAGRKLITDEMREIFDEQRRIDPGLWK